MANWETVTSAKVQRRMHQEWSALEKVANRTAAGTWDDVVSDVISQVVNRVRGRIKACNRNTALGAEGSVPPELISATYILIRLELIATFPGVVTLNDETRKGLAKQANDDLKDTAACDITITPPDTSADSEPPSAPGLYGGDEAVLWPGTDRINGPE